MPRSRNNVAAKNRKKKIFKLAKGYFGRRKNVWTVTKNAVEKADRRIAREKKELDKKNLQNENKIS